MSTYPSSSLTQTKTRHSCPDLVGLDTRAPSPLETLTAAFPQTRQINGLESKKNRRIALEKFNNDSDPSANLLLVQKAIDKGWSGHDTTGVNERVLINLGMPTAPTQSIQQEGRIYRVGQVSDAMFRYFNTGTNWERTAFAQKIAERSSTVENLAMGDQARNLKDTFIAAFEDSDTNEPAPGEGKGGKELDRRIVEGTDFTRAKTFYFMQQKRDARSKSREGTDYFATPEPLGLKMVQWAGIRPNESVLEPSAGHGAIARWFPERNFRTVVEPSYELASKLALNTDAKLVTSQFEDFHTWNKFDAVVMNPPFGAGGATAIKHIAKATEHLREGGRIVALIPTGPAADAKFDKWYESPEAEGMHLTMQLDLPAVTFERAGTSVATRIVILDKLTKVGTKLGFKDVAYGTNRSITADTIGELFDRIENMEAPDRVTPPPSADAVTATIAQAVQPAPAPVAADGMTFLPGQTTHSKTGAPLYLVKIGKRLDSDTYKTVASQVKRLNGYWSNYTKAFTFETQADRDQFLSQQQPANTSPQDAGLAVSESTLVQDDGKAPALSCHACGEATWAPAALSADEPGAAPVPPQQDLLNRADRRSPRRNG
jgi:hypothetical protein